MPQPAVWGRHAPRRAGRGLSAFAHGAFGARRGAGQDLADAQLVALEPTRAVSQEAGANRAGDHHARPVHVAHSTGSSTSATLKTLGSAGQTD